MKAIKCSTSEF